MIYYCLKDQTGAVQAIYNGRLAFYNAETVANRDLLISLRRQNDFESLLKAEAIQEMTFDERKIIKIISHEYAHKMVSRHSPMGLLINGWRVWARICHLVFKDQATVAKYYRARAIYMKETRDYQEKIVELSSRQDVLTLGELEERIQVYRDTIEETDLKICAIWAREEATPPISLQPLLTYLGKKLQENFAIVTSYLDTDGQWREEWIADGGLLNDVKGPDQHHHQGKQNLRKWLNKIRPEPLSRKQTILTDLAWLRIGMSTQRKILNKVYGLSDRKIQADYIIPSTIFASHWSGKELSLHVTFNLIQAAAFKTESDFNREWKSFVGVRAQNRALKKFINFFYLHGN